jgi:tRNA(fMet)-specific endonuclease VapC
VIVLDTDHLSVWQHPGSTPADALAARLEASSDEPPAITIISVLEQFRGWSARINRAKDVDEEVRVFGRLSGFIDFVRRTPVLPYDNRAAEIFADLRQRKIRIGSMDLKIASIALANDALLLTANLREFGRVPGLRVEDWLRP